MLLQIYYDFFFQFFHNNKSSQKYCRFFFSNTYTYTTYYKLFSFQSNLHLRLQTGFYSAKICTVVLLQINFHPVLYYSTKNQAYVLCILIIQYVHKCTFCIKTASMAYYKHSGLWQLMKVQNIQCHEDGSNFINQRCVVKLIVQRNASKFAIFYVYENPKLLFPFFIL